MKVLVHQHAHLGHHYQYVGHLLAALTRTSHDVVVAVTPAGRRSHEFESFVARFEPSVRFEAILPEADPGYPFRERLRLHRDLRAAVEQFKPDHVLIPSGDGQATAMAFYTLAGLGAVPQRIPCEVGIHFGTGQAAASLKARVRDRMNLLNLALSGAKRVHLVNLLFYEAATSLGGLARQRFTLMPHPVSASTPTTKTQARRKLGIPEDGRYIGLAASLDRRKAIAEFIAAFRDATHSGSSDRLLLAGWMHPDRADAIARDYRDLVEQGRLVLLTRFLEQGAFEAAIAAMDVVCTPYPGFAGLSATLLEGAAAGRPILANHFGWCRAIVRRFQLGWTCDVLNHSEFTGAIRQSLDRSADYVASEATGRLLQFHTPENFGATWVESIGPGAAEPNARPLKWEWVEEAVPADRRRLY